MDADWPFVELSSVCSINPETINPGTAYSGQSISYIDIGSVNGTGRFLGYAEGTVVRGPHPARRLVSADDVLLSTVRPNLQAITLLSAVRERTVASTGFAVLRANLALIVPKYLFVASNPGCSWMWSG